MMRLPEEYTDRMKRLLGDEYPDFILSYEHKSYRGLRLNRVKVSGQDTGMEDKLIDTFGLTPVPWCRDGYYYDADLRPGSHPYHEAGIYYIQEPSAMLPGELACGIIREKLSDRGYVRVLDMCAAPGGKTTHVAGAIGDKGILISNEPVPDRARILSQNVERMGIRSCIVSVETPERLAQLLPGYFDVILTDVPCSGEGMFRKDETAIEQWSAENVDRCVIRTRDILETAHMCLKPDGHIVYSTCTYERDEDEGMMEYFTDRHPEYSLISSRRIWPHRDKGEGHYAAVLHRGVAGISYTADSLKRCEGLVYDGSISAQVREYIGRFVTDTLNDRGTEAISGTVYAYGDNIYTAPKELADIAVKKRSLRIERPGLHIGELKKGRLEPSHSLVMALAPDMCRNVVSLSGDAEEIRSYIAGESIACNPDIRGYAAVVTDGYTLGWGKAVNGVLKNHYPKGLRRFIGK